METSCFSRGIIYSRLFILFCWSCNRTDGKLEYALELAGENRKELERVLEHYSVNLCDSLKLRGARFLIENMPGHYTLGGPLMDEYRRQIYADTAAAFYAKKSLEICMTHMKVIQDASEKQEDVRHLSADFLIRHIDRSFEKLATYPWLEDLPFDLFLEYVLPYRIGHERPDLWIDSIDILPEALEEIRKTHAIKYSAEALWEAPKLAHGSYSSPNNLGKKLFGITLNDDCLFRELQSHFHARVAAFPQSIECIPVYANRNGYHYWNTLQSSESKTPSIGRILERKASKIYSLTFSRQRDITPRSEEFIPPFFRNPFYKDVSDQYMHTADITVPMRGHVDRHPRYAYLCVFNNQKWQPVTQSGFTASGTTFHDMGKNLVYLPVCYQEDKMTACNYPFILNLKGETEHLVPDTIHRQCLTLYRKYPLSKNLYKYSRDLETVLLELSSDVRFTSPDTVRFTAHEACTYAVGLPDTTRSYTHFRITTPGTANLAELSFIDTEGNTLPIHAAPLLVRAFDGDPVTNIRSNHPQNLSGTFPRPVRLSYLLAFPRSDGNGIYPGDSYELFYHDADAWRSLGRRTATEHHLHYDNIPRNALLWLHNHTRGVEERIFTIEPDSSVRFW